MLCLATLSDSCAKSRALTAEQQLPYVEEFYSPARGKLTNAVQCYVATHLPALVSRAGDLNTVLCRNDDTNSVLRAANASNLGFDTNKKGYITRRGLAAAIARAQKDRDNAKRWAEIVARLKAN